MKVLTVSDIHGEIRKELREDVAKRKLEVDLILLLGDLTNTPLYGNWPNAGEAKKKRIKEIENHLLPVVSRINSKYGIALLFGNDDYRELAEEFAKPDIGSRMKEKFNAASLDFRYTKFDGHWFVGMGGSSKTPWDTPNELTEEEMYRKGLKLFEEVKELDSLAKIVLASHSPSKGILDTVSHEGKEDHAGSEAIRKLVEKYEPVVHVHGHVHRSFGTEMNGKTVVLNTACWYESSNPSLGKHYGYVELEKNGVTATLYKVGQENPLSRMSSH